ncbi:MAG: glycosyltransferase family 4 protein [Acidobacteriota bacterium]
MLTQFYWPEVRSAPNNLAALAEDLQTAGHRVTVITGFPNHPFGRIYDGYRQRLRQWDEVFGVPVLRVPLYPDHSLSSLRRLLHYGSFALSCASIGAWTTRKMDFDVVVVYLPPWTNWLPIRVIEWFHPAPLVYIVTDVWPESLIGIGRTLAPWQLNAINRLVDAVARRATAICVNSEGYQRLLRERGTPADRLELLVDFADDDVFHPSDPEPELARRHGLEGRFNVLYGGNLGAAQGLETMIEAAELLVDLPELQFVFVGDGTHEQEIKELAAARRLGNVRFIDRQPMEEMHRFFALADVLAVHLIDSPAFAYQVPSKTIAYMACGRPVLCGVSGSAAEMIEEAGAGLCCRPGDPADMAAKVRELYAMPQEARKRLGDSGRAAYLEKYTRAAQSRKLERLLTQVVGPQTTE